jgi:hypothetical protein
LLEVSNAAGSLIARTFIRSMLSSDGQVSVSYYQIKPQRLRRVRLLLTGLLNFRFIDAPAAFARGMKTRHCVDVMTEFSDGRHLLTSNAKAAALISGPPSIENRFFPYGTPTARLLSHHLEELADAVYAEVQKILATERNAS